MRSIVPPPPPPPQNKIHGSRKTWLKGEFSAPIETPQLSMDRSPTCKKNHTWGSIHTCTHILPPRHRNCRSLTSDLSLVTDNSQCVRYLGVLVDQHLAFKEQVGKVVADVNRKLAAFHARQIIHGAAYTLAHTYFLRVIEIVAV